MLKKEKKSFVLLIILAFFFSNCFAIDDFIKKAIQSFNIKIMALYFPQFHEVEENNLFWGTGFTEWTLINRFQGELKKPHNDIGQYNMLDYGVRKKQAEMAKEHGISAFCYYHYWFKDKKVMYKGIEKILEDGEPNIPFAFCWANESWTRNWFGSVPTVLIEQEYGLQNDWDKHYEYLLQFFKHPNYIKENNCPIFYVYRFDHIIDKNAQQMFKYWKKRISKDGFSGLKIIALLAGFKNNFTVCLTDLIDVVDGFAEHQPTFNGRNAKNCLISKNEKQIVLDAQKMYQAILDNKKLHANYSRGIFYGWDNSPRRINNKSIKFVNTSYQAFEDLLTKTIINITQDPNEQTNYILLNSWNEWTEQAMVEPNTIDGYAILETIKKIMC